MHMSYLFLESCTDILRKNFWKSLRKHQVKEKIWMCKINNVKFSEGCWFGSWSWRAFEFYIINVTTKSLFSHLGAELDVSWTSRLLWRRWSLSGMTQNGHWLPNPFPIQIFRDGKSFSNHNTSQRETKCWEMSSRRSQCHAKMAHSAEGALENKKVKPSLYKCH